MRGAAAGVRHEPPSSARASAESDGRSAFGCAPTPTSTGVTGEQLAIGQLDGADPAAAVDDARHPHAEPQVDLVRPDRSAARPPTS